MAVLPLSAAHDTHHLSDTKPTVEMADIFREHGAAYQKTQGLSYDQIKAMHAIMNCRTSVLGGHKSTCDNCGVDEISYNSCRNRHCPKCQTIRKLKWITDRESELLPVPYFHVVFTLPHELNSLILSNKEKLYDLLFKAASKTLLAFGHDTKRLGGELGAIMVLHTWGQTLSLHPHIHCIVPGGALTPENKWVSAKSNYLFPVKAMAKLFRTYYLKALKACYNKGELEFHGTSQQLADENRFKNLIETLWKKNWIVYAKKPFDGPKQVIRYLSNYTHRVAISNYRLLKMENNLLSFQYKDYADNNKTKVMTLTCNDFIQRFLLHVLPPQFTRIRQIGFLANRYKKEKLEKCRSALNSQLAEVEEKTGQAIIKDFYDIDIDQCTHCKIGKMKIVLLLSNQFSRAKIADTS